MSLTGDFFNGLEKRKKKKDDIAPIRTTTKAKDDDIGPVLVPTKAQLLTAPTVITTPEIAPEKEWYDKIVKKPDLFDDGYQAGDISKTILGTGADFSLNVLTGVGNFAEGIGDTINYGIADIFEKVGNKDFANVLREETKKSVVQKLLGETTETVDKWSVLDGTSDSVAQGLGMITTLGAGGMALGGAGIGAAGQTALSTGGTLFSGIGSGMSEAYEGGATDEEARTYGLISGTADALSELIFGGLGKGINAVGFSKGLSSADDMLAKKISNMFSSQIAKNLTQYGIKASAEGLEEVLSGLAQGIGKKITYMSEEELDEILKDENLLEQFVVGSVTSAIAQSGDFYTSAKTGTDFITGLTENEQKVVDKEVENRIAEREKNGEKVTNKDKSKIYDKVVADLDKGYITIDTIESALGGETYDNYKSITEQEESLQNEFNTLNQMKQGDMTGEQIDRRAELKQQLEELKNTSKKTELKDKLSNDVFNLVKDSRLAESYNEKTRRGQSFEADLSKYDTKQQEVIKKAVESGILNNTNRTHEFVDMIAKISADKGVLFDFTNNEKLKNSGFAVEGKTVNGYKTEDGNIALNIQSHKALESVVGHEITHILEGTELYSALQEAVKQYATTKGEYVARMQSLRELYTGVYKGKDFDTKLQAELTADIVGDYLFSDSDFINSLSTEQPNLFKKIYNEIKYLCKVATAGSKEARELEKVKKAFENAWKESVTTEKNTTNKGDVKYSLSGSDIKAAQSIGRKNINSLTPVELNNLSEFAQKYWEELGTKSPFLRAWFGDWRENDKTPVIIATKNDATRGLVKNTDTGWDINVSGQVFNETNKQKSTSSVEARPYLPYIRDIMKNAVLLDSYGIDPKKSDNSLLMHSFYSVADIGTGAEVLKVYVEEMYDPATKNTNKRAYQLKNIEKAFAASVRVQGKSPSSLTNTANAIKNVADLFSVVKQYDKNFTPKPASKIVNEDGTPKVMYHGTPNDFAIFDKKKTKSYGYYGRGFYFTNSESHSQQYGNSMAVYLDVKNPLEQGKNNISKTQLQKFLEAVAENEDYDIWNYGTEDISKIIDSIYKNDAFSVIQDVNATAIGDLAEAIALFNDVNGTSYDGVITPTETVVYESTQIKSATDNIGTFDNNNPDIRYSLSEETDYSRIADMQKEVNQLTNSIKEIEASEDFKLQVDNLSKAIDNDDIENGFYKEVIANDDLAGRREQVNEWYENRKAELHEELDDKNAFVSNKAKALYTELNGLKKGVRASEELGYFLDFGFNWSELKSTLLKVSKWSDTVINPDSNVESVVREAIGREYEDRLYDFDDLDAEYQNKLKNLEKSVNSPIRTVKERLTAKLENVRKELLMNQQLRDDSIADFEQEIIRLQAVYNGKRDKNTKAANNILRRIERLQRMKNDVDADYSKRISDIENRIAKLESKDYATVEQRKTKQQELRAQMENLVGDTSTWVDKKLGISYKVNTLRRNLRDIVRDANGKRDIAKADAIYDELQGKYNHNEAELNREANRIKQQFEKMKITSAEDTYIQMLGELRHNPETTLTEDAVKDFYNKHKKNIDEAKVDKAIEMARPLYDDLLSRVNQVLSEQGMKEIPYRKGYFPHFTEDKQGFLAKLFNWKTKNNDIPTDIAGLTEEFNPNRSWQSFNKQRKTDTTDYSFLKGLDSYVQGSLDWIYHIEDIQKRRALENHIRYVHSEQGIKERIDAIRNNEEYDANEMQDQIDLVYKEAGNPLNNFVKDFRTATNTLAGKKSSLDRGAEEMTNRQFYSTMTNISNRVSANMVAGSISSALTNFIPITQSWGQVSPISSLKAMGETIRSTFRDDGTIDKSDFLTNRLRKSENLYKDFWDKFGDGIGILMESIDSFTSQTVWRSKYLENISKGMSENAAIKDADQFAENILAGRSRGNNPTIFDSKSPLTKIFTVFQLEVNNQYGYMFKDMPQDMANESKAKLVKGYITMFLGAYAYNALYSSLVGRDAAFDPIGIIEDLLRDLGFGGDDEEEEEIAPTDAILNLTNNVLEELPFVGGLLGGGRIPLSSALPYGGITEAFEGTLQDLSEGNTETLTKEWLNPVLYLAMPMGGGQLKKSWQGLKMFDDDLPIAGSYTDSGNLRFPIEDTPLNRIQAGLFGQYANKNARKYFDDDIAPLKEKQIQEFIDVDLPIADYWKYREKLKDFEKQDEKVAYINGLDVTEEQKNTLKSYLYDEEGYKKENPEKYAFLEKEGIGFLGYKEADDETQDAWSWAFNHQDEYRHLKENGVNPEDYSVYYSPRVEFDDEGDKAYEWAFDNPEKATVGKVFSNGVKEYRQYTTALYNIKADKDSNGKSISGSRKKKVLDYINNLNIDYGAKCILLKSEYSSEDRYNKAIVDYLNSRDDITTEEKRTILEELGATIDSNGYIHW